MSDSSLVNDQLHEPISAIILAGGRGSRMGHVDKGLVELEGKRLIEHVIDRIHDHVNELIISCNRNLDEYQRYGTVVPDREAGFPGPLMGMLSASSRASTSLCLVVPCDMPGLPEDLCPRLAAGLGSHDACVVHDGHRLQPLVALIRQQVIGSIDEYLASGNSTVKGWLDRIDTVTLDFSDQANAFENVNDPIKP